MTAYVDQTVDASGGTAGPLPGRVIAGRYVIRSLLGTGGMGRVWLAHDELLDRPVAVKQDMACGSDSGESHRVARVRALTEARAAARVKHDGIITIYDIVREGCCPWIVMEPLSGRTLAERLTSDAALSIDEVVHLGLRVLDILQVIHGAGIVHRDVKPANIHLCPDGRVVLTDFGIAGMVGDEPPTTLAGSPAYISPEQLRGASPAPAADLFSVGATLFTAVERRPPFGEGDLPAMLVALMHGDRAPMVRAGRLRPVIAGLLATEPRDRLSLASARDMLQDLSSPPHGFDSGGRLYERIGPVRATTGHVGTGTRAAAGRWGGIGRPSGSSSPVSSNRITPLQSRLHPCTGCATTTRAAVRSERPANGQGG